MVTTIPWAIVFGLMSLMLIVFPGWLSPFSNTIGYLFAKLAGVGTLMDKIIAPKSVNADTAVERLKPQRKLWNRYTAISP